MSTVAPDSLDELLLLRSGLLFLDEAGPSQSAAPLNENQLRGFHLELAQLGYLASTRLAERASRATAGALIRARELVGAAHQKATGAPRRLEPMFRQFPDGVPADTLTLWWDRVVVHFLQQPEQPCVLCRQRGTIHVLDPCMHLVCSNCFDGSNYAGCPICNRAVDEQYSSGFFKPAPARPAAAVSSTTFALLDLGNVTAEHTVHTAARALFTALCLRTQAMSPTDVDSLLLLARTYRDEVIPWLPEVIPVRENRALIFGSLLRDLLLDGVGHLKNPPPKRSLLDRTKARAKALLGAIKPEPAAAPITGAPPPPRPDPLPLLEAARAHLTTATDVLRTIVVYSGASPALLATAAVVASDGPAAAKRFGKRATTGRGYLAISHQRFKVAHLPRPLRRGLLALLDALPPAQLLEDMQRHDARWVWVGEHLHPGEYGKRYPGIARVFSILRNGQESAAAASAASGASSTSTSGATPTTPGTAGAPSWTPLRTWPSAVEAAIASRATGEALLLLSQRPGEFLRRFDLLLRRAANPDAAVDAFAAVVPRTASPALVALRAHLAVRAQPLPARVFWPKANFCVPTPPVDSRPPLPAAIVARTTALLDEELVRRFAAKPAFDTALLDEDLADIIVPFNERTASKSAVQLPRGSSVALPDSSSLRLFMHWCEPERSSGYSDSDSDTDLDLSVGFFDDAWRLVGTCAYYNLSAKDAKGRQLAASSGDFTSAPWPDGSSEFVDFDRVRARQAGYRYAVMVVNAYSGLPFRDLARATAGVMLRDDLKSGEVFDPRTVSLAFALDGANGVFMPLVVDLQTSRLHWLDAYSRGQLQHNNVATSKQSIGRICPAMLAYFASGTRPSMLDLARYHAAARCRRVLLRQGDTVRAFVRKPDESAAQLLARLRSAPAPDAAANSPAAHDERFAAADLPAQLGASPVFAALLRGDLALPEGSASYALFRQQLTPTLAAADLLA